MAVCARRGPRTAAAAEAEGKLPAEDDEGDEWDGPPENGSAERLPTDAHGAVPKDLEPDSREAPMDVPPDPEEEEAAPDLSMLEDMQPTNDRELNTCLRSAGIPQPWKPLKLAAMVALYTTVPARDDMRPEMWTAIWQQLFGWFTAGKLEDVRAEQNEREATT